MNRKKGSQVSVDPFIFHENVEIDRAASPLRRRRPAGRGERPCRVLAQLRRLQRPLRYLLHVFRLQPLRRWGDLPRC